MYWFEIDFSAIPDTFHSFTFTKVVPIDEDAHDSESDLEHRKPEIDYITYVVDVNGVANRIGYVDQTKDLSSLVDEKYSKTQVLEFFGGDSLQLERGNYIATCWVVQDQTCQNVKQFGVVFKVDIENDTFEKIAKIDFPSCFAHNKLYFNSNDEIIWTLFPVKEEISVLKLSPDEKSLNWVEKEEWSILFPDLNFGVVPGVVMCGSRVQNGNLLWNVYGCETGDLTLRVYDTKRGSFIGQKTLKFSAAVSIAELISTKTERDEFPNEILLMVSSSVGPITLWRCSVDNECLSWKRISILAQSELNDSITCCLQGEYSIFIGVYADNVLVYARPSLFSDISEHLDPIGQVEVPAPVVKMCFLDSEEDTVGVMSTEGFHTLMMTDSPYLDVFTGDGEEDPMEEIDSIYIRRDPYLETPPPPATDDLNDQLAEN